MLTMNGRSILNIRDFQQCFSLTEVLRQHREFAAFAVRTLSRTGDAARAWSLIFSLCSMRVDGRFDQLEIATVPHLKCAPEHLRELLERPLPSPQDALAYAKALVACLAEEAQTPLYLPAATTRETAEFAAMCELQPNEQNMLFLMLVAACRLKCISFRKDVINPLAAVSSLYPHSIPAEEQWTALPQTGDLLLEERELPWRLMVHPAWNDAPDVRTLPANAQLDVMRIRAVPNSYGSTQHAAIVQFFADKNADEPICQIALHAGEYVTATAVSDDAHARMPLPPRGDRRMAGADVMTRPDLASDELLLNGKPASHPAGRLTGFTPDGSGGYVVLLDGKVDDSAFTRRAFTLDFLMDVRGERFIDVAVRDAELVLLCPDGHVLSSYDHIRTDRPLLTLDDYFA